MGLLRCADCAAKEAALKAKEEHVTFLQGLVKELQAKLLEALVPGGNARIAAAERLTATPVPHRESKKKPEPDLERQQMAPLPGHD